MAASAALETAAAVEPDDDLVVLVSGGASALMARASEGLTLSDKQSVTRQLLASGADIAALNCVRKHLSAVKGGRLAHACRGRVHAWLLSDVVGDDPSVIGSGPTVPDPTTFVDALDVLDRFGGRTAFPPAVVSHLVEGAAGRREETPKTADALHRATTEVIGSAALAVAAAAGAARERGYAVLIRPEPVVGEARAAAAAHVEWVRRMAKDAGRPLCVLSSGETTVHVTGNGRGGRNQEFALGRRAGSTAAGVGPRKSGHRRRRRSHRGGRRDRRCRDDDAGGLARTGRDRVSSCQ